MTLTVIHKRDGKSGGQYRKTLQYGYDRQQGIDRWMGQRLNGLDPWKHIAYVQVVAIADYQLEHTNSLRPKRGSNPVGR